ncbi:hypothetical protein ACFE04_031107 [Oxalis oulophora]
MAGDIEESYSFQADSFHSGSISFGRYEKESLDWERRSSFSHNRYVEEAEKCLKPGSVTEKKAYLEAHFKRKGGILSPESSGSISCRDYQNSDSDANGNVQRDIFETVKEGTHAHETGLENGNYREEYNYRNEDSQCEYESEILDYANYDESSEGWGYEGEYETTEHEREINESSGHVLDNAIVVETIFEDIKIEVTHKTETESGLLPIESCGPVIEVNHDFNRDGFNMDVSSQQIDISSQSYPAPESETATSENQSPKAWPATESKPNKPTLRTGVVKKSRSQIAAKTATAKPLHRREKESPVSRKQEKLAPQTVTPTKTLLHRMPKTMAADNSKAKLNHQSKSEKEPRGKKLVCSQTSAVKKDESRSYRENRINGISRSKRTVSSPKPDPKPSALPFNFKSSERAERRKEFSMKMEEKMNAKEAEMNQIQAKTQEKKEVELKNLRRRLNFKASPMPSFYSSPLPAGSEGNKAGSSSNISTKSRNKSTSPPSESGSISSPPPTKSSKTLETTRKSGTPTKKHSEKEKDSSMQKHRASVSPKVTTKDQKAEGKLKTGMRRTGNEMVRKSIKGISIGSCVAVGVAS